MRCQGPIFDEQESHSKVETYRFRMDDEECSNGTYAKIVDEFDKLSDVLQETRTTLRITQKNLRESEKKSKLLELHLETEEQEMHFITSENQVLISEEQRLRGEIDRLEKVAKERGSRQTYPATDERLKKAVELLNKELSETKDELEVLQITILTQKSQIDRLNGLVQILKARSEQVEGVESGLGGELKTCKMKLKEAQIQSSDLLEEVADIREKLKVKNNVTSRRFNLLTAQEKDKIRVEEREATTKLLTYKIQREVTAEVNAQKEKEINGLREEFQKVFKANSLLRERLDAAEAVAEEAEKLEDEAPKLKYEVSRLLTLLEATRNENATIISELQTNFRVQAQAIQEKHTREKWTQTSEIRKQLSKERETELLDFKRRMEYLLSETNRHLEKAEIDKDMYGEAVKKNIMEEKQLEIDALKGKLRQFTNETQNLLESAALEKRECIAQIREQMKEENHHKISKYTSQIEVLESAKEKLENRVATLEQKTRKENEKAFSQGKEVGINRNQFFGEIFDLKMNNGGLSSKIQRYKKAGDKLVTESINVNTRSSDGMGEEPRDSKASIRSDTDEGMNHLRAEIANLHLALPNAMSKIKDLNNVLTKANSSDNFDDTINIGNEQTKEQLRVSEDEKHRLQQKLKECKKSDANEAKEFEHSQQLFENELAKSEQRLFLTGKQQISFGGEADIKEAYNSLMVVEKKNRGRIDLLENLLSRAARDSLKVSKRLHEHDQRFCVFLAEFGEEQMDIELFVKKHTSGLERSRNENIRLSTELKNTMRCLREALLSWKKGNARFESQIEAWKTTFSSKGQKKSAKIIKANRKILEDPKMRTENRKLNLTNCSYSEEIICPSEINESKSLCLDPPGWNCSVIDGKDAENSTCHNKNSIASSAKKTEVSTHSEEKLEKDLDKEKRMTPQTDHIENAENKQPKGTSTILKEHSSLEYRQKSDKSRGKSGEKQEDEAVDHKCFEDCVSSEESNGSRSQLYSLRRKSMSRRNLPKRGLRHYNRKRSKMQSSDFSISPTINSRPLDMREDESTQVS
jgi:hypothetical protein